MIPENSDLAKLLFNLIKAIERDLEYMVTATAGPPPAWRVRLPQERYYFLIREALVPVSQLVVLLFRHPVASTPSSLKTIWVTTPRKAVDEMRQAVIRQLIEDHSSGPS